MAKEKKVKKVKKVLKVKKVVEPIEPIEPKLDKFLATLNINGVDYKGEGNTVFEALKVIEAPFKTFRGTVSLQYGEKKAERFLSPVQMKKFIKGNKLNRLGLSKFLTLLLK